MDSSWQVKFGSALQSSMPAIASSTSQEARDQMEINSGHCFHSRAGQDLRLQMHGRMPDPTFPSITTLSSCSSTHTDLSSSFLALLSMPASLSKFDFQDLSNPKLFNNSGKLANEIGSVAPGHQLPSISGRLPLENMSYQNLQSGDDLCPIASSRVVAYSNSGSSSVFQNVHPAANISHQGLGLAKTANHHAIPGDTSVKDFYSLRGERHSMPLINGVKLQNVDRQMLQKLPSEVKPSASKNSSIFLSGCPRVFCLDKSGHLLFSNTGILGILCSCHCFRMSASRFCEHSGLCNVNPGDAIRMDSGETIAQWCKLNFQKFGIRIPEDQSGWDWPEGLSFPASSMKSGISMSNMPKNSGCSNLIRPSGDLLRSGWPLVDVSPKNFLVNQNSVISELHNKRQKNGQDCNKIYYKGLVGTSQSYSCDMGGNHVTDCSTSRCSAMPQFAGRGPENASQSIYAIVESGSSATTHSGLQKQRNLVKNCDVNRGEDVQDFGVKNKVSLSSSMELKLGQPYQDSHSSGDVVLPAIGPPFHSTIVNSQKPSSQEQIIHNAINSESEEEPRCYLPRAFTIRREQGHLNYTNFPIDNTLDAPKLEKLKGNVAKTSVVSLSKYCTLPEGSSQPRAADNLLYISEHVTPKMQHCESRALKCDLINAPGNGGNDLDRQWMIHESSISKLADKGEGIGCLVGNSYVQTASGSKLQKWMENTKSSTGVPDGNNCSLFPPMHDKSHYSHCLSNMPPNASDAENFSNCLEKVLFSGSGRHIDHVFLRSMGSSMDSKQNSASQGVPIGSSSSSSNSTPAFAAAMPCQDSSVINRCSFDDNLRFLALGQMLGLSKHQHMMSSLGKNLEQGKQNNPSNVRIKHSFVEPSKVEEQRHVPNFSRKEGVSEILMQRKLDLYNPPSKMVNDVEKFTSVTGFSRWCNCSTLEQGRPLKCNEFGMHCQLSHGPLYSDHSLFRLNGSQSTDCSNGHGSCCQKPVYFQCNCSCVADTKCLGGNCNKSGANPPNSLREQMGSMSRETPVSIASQFAKDFTVPKDNAISLDQCGMIKGQLHKNFNCCGSQWKDVPSKVISVHELAHVKQSTDALDERRHELFQLENSAAKYSNGAVLRSDSFKEQDMSNLSSGCSTLAVSQASIEVTNVDSSIIVGTTGYESNLIVDEGSGIDKCWSSDDAIESDKSADFYGFTCKSDLRRQKSCEVTGHKLTRSLLDEVKLMDSLTWKKGQNQKHSGIIVHGKSNQSQESEKGFRFGKRKRAIKLKMLDSLSGTVVASLPDKSSECDGISNWQCLSKNVQTVPSGPESSQASGAHSIKIKPRHGNSKLTDTKTRACKRDSHKSYDAGEGEGNCETDINHENSCENLGRSGRKKFRSNQTAVICTHFQMQESTQAVAEKTVKYDSNNCNETSSNQQVNLCDLKPKPVVCGKYGEIINRNMTGEVLEPVKIFSLDKILKTAKRCSLPRCYKAELASSKKLKRINFSWSNACFDKSSSLMKERELRSNNAQVRQEMNIHLSMEERNIFSDEELYVNDFSMVGKKDHESGDEHIIQDTSAHAHSRPKHKEIRKRSLYELTLRGKNLGPKIASQKKIFKYAPKIHRGNILTNSDKSCNHKSRKVKRCIREQKHLSVTDVDSFCCVCGMSNTDEINCLLECGQCSIRVHQACYGVSKVPKGHWYCRPCRTNSKDIVCVLCGYGGGAMTRALQSRSIAKSLLKAWNLEVEVRLKSTVSSSVTMQNEQGRLQSSGSVPESHSFFVLRPINSEPSTSIICNMEAQNQSGILKNSSGPASYLKLHNSITAGVLDSTVKQWVHVVCGLWTPGTWCPNVDTMSAFDVSAVSYPGGNMVCSVCNRRGGSCIQCRVVNCSVQFHPWCAHQKGLLQSEAEGIDNENVGFYGKCLLHATCRTNGYPCHTTNNEDHLGEKEASCARTEGYKGRKRDGFWHNINIQSEGKGGCLVPQEQLNAWIHINGQKSCARGFSRLPISEKEHDCRKEYTRYRQTKGWKHLVVYKSGIHALGLYTSRFISRGEMVVEYVGEIVGLRVADKRENEYQSGRRLQYKSACYFFRIDKEHIIDATCKGGIARFVNHSCLPNCVAKVISVRNEKKVVFLAERDIYPGEEITYDYHFNHEDEGKKIPCFCNEKNCRRYLN